MSKQIRKRLEIIEDHFGKMALRDFVRVDGGPDTPLHKAAHSGKCAKLKMLIEEEELFGCLNKKNHLGCTPLRLAATAGHEECVRYLIEQGADLNVSDIKAQTALYVAVKNKHLNCVKLLLKAGGNPNGDLHCLCTPLYVASMDGNLPVVQELVAYGADLDRSQINLGSFISTPLYITIAYDHFDCFKALLQNGANPDAAVNNKHSDRKNLPSCQSLYHATAKHSCDVEYVNLLYEFGASLHHRDDKGRLACDGDVENQCSKRIRQLIRVPRNLQSTIRLFVRCLIGKNSLWKLDTLPLPKKLIYYLQHR